MGKVRPYKDWQRVSEVLWEVWDPIGVNTNPSAEGEYDSYVGDVLELLRNGCTVEDLISHLHRVETEQMGMGGGFSTTATAQALLKLELDGT